MKRADEWFAEYDRFHRNSTNKVLHAICIPIIMFSLLGFLWSIPVPWGGGVWGNVATLVMVLSLGYYVALSPALAVAMLCVSSVMLLGNYWLDAMFADQFIWVCGVLFVVGWTGQFLGHKIEGKKPAFFDDLRFLLIGPLWLIAFLYRRLGIPY